ncbi:RNA 2',3'-cyclic phosphodiesterase [Pseudomonas chlororaphis]|uniref:RNA 2',3'-cyclic phosphodiesterase n=1 Tax=Pseudomonas chlororaphis TaxID=587753 RepID=UPI00215AFB94|nr:RNA 2',3'-cyclic phosphodiesterase [Pseudomonas chlororaphis]UVE48225.1 RNA 2',3'-cyclic phosphodiesterase [Pseudomonas chlororaphis]
MNDESREQGEPFKRLFFALPCTAAQRRAIAQWRGALGLRNGRPVPAENFHLTLMFLGSVAVAQIPRICAAAASVRTCGEPLDVPLDRLEVWRRAGVLLLAPTQAPLELRQLVYALQEALLPLGLVDSPREFRPHLTLMRDYRAPVPESQTPADFHLSARHFALFESHKGRYRPLAEWALAR